MGVSDGKQVASESPRLGNAFADQHEEDSLLIRQADQMQGVLLPLWPLPPWRSSHTNPRSSIDLTRKPISSAWPWINSFGMSPGMRARTLPTAFPTRSVMTGA